MARIRTVKPEFFTSHTIAALPHDTRLCFIGLWTWVDDAGRGPDDARLVKAAVWPLDDAVTPRDVARMLDELTVVGLVTRYEAEGRALLQVTAWGEHQRINRPVPSRFPGPDRRTSVSTHGALTEDSVSFCDDPPEGANAQRTGIPENSLSPHGVLSEDSLQERKGKERKGTTHVRARPGDASTAPDPSPDGDAFDRFWKTYPRREDRGHALKAWQAATRNHDPERIIAAAAAFASLATRQRTERKFLPYPATWLRGQRWLDEPGQNGSAPRILNGAVLDEGVL